MSWMSQLFKTYENNIGKDFPGELPLTPIAHMSANAQLEITLNQEGEIQTAEKIEKEDATTLIPVTEQSAGRSSGIAPHALCDTLSYLAGDFFRFCETEKQKKSAQDKFQEYMENLQNWAESNYAHPKVQAVFTYLSKQRAIEDLIKAGLVEVDEEGFFSKNKISGQPYEKALVRFRVLSTDMEERTWKDPSLLQAYTEYYLAGQQGKTDTCYLTGQERIPSENHPKGIVAADYGAKLVSANDGQGYTYRGRFQNAKQAYALSYEASQKIHSALTWLTKTQGEMIGTQDKRTFVCWNPQGKSTPALLDGFGLIEDEEESLSDISYRKKLKKTLQGYQDQFDETDEVIVMSLDAATTGRLSVTYYNELPAIDFFERVAYWGETCRWEYLKFNAKKQPYRAVETPIFRRIAECAFGREKNKFIEADDKVLKEQTQRLVKCMLEKQPLPFDLVQALTLRASLPTAYSGGNRERVLSTACAVISKYHFEKNRKMKGAQDDMKLDLNNHDRSYLFGRLLAVCEKVERATYDRDEKRDPNAIRLQAAYVNHPMQTWKTLEGLLNPYFQKLTPGSREYYRSLIGEIVASLQEEDADKLNQALKETYLLGYYLQRSALNQKKEQQEGEK